MDRQLVFLIGAGRSGTTLLYKLLALHPDVGFISNYDRVLPGWVPSGLLVRALRHRPQAKRAMWFEDGGNAYFLDKAGLRRLFPAPAEGETVYTRCGLPLTPPADYRLPPEVTGRLQRRFARLQALAGTRVFMTKRTANNRRIPWLREAFPEARFIHLIRDGRDVAYSLARVSWWPDHTVFWAGKTPRELEAGGMHPLEICARNWVEEVQAVQRGLAAVEPDKRLEVRYESLLERPLGELRSIARFLNLGMPPGFEAAIEALGLARRGPAWSKTWTESDQQRVATQQQVLLKQLRYV